MNSAASRTDDVSVSVSVALASSLSTQRLTAATADADVTSTRRHSETQSIRRRGSAAQTAVTYRPIGRPSVNVDGLFD